MTTPGHGADPLVGHIVDGRYELRARIGEGGTGIVYRARQTTVGRDVAVKMLSPQVAREPGWVQRFESEARACSRLQHPNTIKLLDVGMTADGSPYMAMELLTGTSLRRAIDAGAPLAPDRVMSVLAQCCGSLAEAHDCGIVHRDLKPDNVFLLEVPGSQDFVKILDFSVAKLLRDSAHARTQAGVVFGTPAYMAPEQGRGIDLDARADLYSLGIVGFEMLTGRVPFAAEAPLATLRMHANEPLPPLPADTPAPVAAVIQRALEKDRDARYRSAPVMLEACRGALAGGAPPPRPASAPEARTVLAGSPPAGVASLAGAADENTVLASSPAGARETSAAGAGAPAAPPADDEDAPRTLMLQNSEGIVSFARQVAAEREAEPSGREGRAGAVLFWLACVAAGLGFGVAAYLAVVHLGG